MVFEDGIETRLSLLPGDIIVFEGDVIHAGAAYSQANLRVHAYLDGNRPLLARTQSKHDPLLDTHSYVMHSTQL